MCFFTLSSNSFLKRVATGNAERLFFEALDVSRGLADDRSHLQLSPASGPPERRANSGSQQLLEPKLQTAEPKEPKTVFCIGKQISVDRFLFPNVLKMLGCFGMFLACAGAACCEVNPCPHP